MKILYHRSVGPTARRIAEVLGIESTRNPTPEDTIVIRWGSSLPAANDMAINTRQAIGLAAHGLNSILKLIEAGVPTVSVYRTLPEDPDLYPLLGRGVNHRAGLDIVWVDSPTSDVEQRSYYTKFVRMDKELRVHVFGGEVLRVFRKVPRTCDADTRVKTSLRGWGYHVVNHTKHYKKAQAIAIQAVSALGLTFGAVDIGWNEGEVKYYVFEVNTGPALNSITLHHYCSKFIEHLLGLREVEYNVPEGLRGTRENHQGDESSDKTE